ncbi:MAG: hypothetical protein II969_05025 [Anaerolineaceae bacterium]|nr:hypothetical protein [Anaerolineaceae bacterium]
MYKKAVILFIILLSACVFSAVSADNVVKNVTYGETYLCNDAYTIRIITQPQMVYQIIEKLNIDIGYKKTSLAIDNVYYYLYREYRQAAVQYGRHRENNDILLNIRLEFRNLNAAAYHGLSPESFKLVGKVRDRKIEYTPEIMIPFNMDTEWELPLIRAGVEAKAPMEPTKRLVKETVVFNLDRYWDTLLMKQKDIESMRVQEMRLMFRVPNWLFSWELHINPQPMIADDSLRSCEMIMPLSVIKNEVTGEIYKYVP